MWRVQVSVLGELWFTIYVGHANGARRKFESIVADRTAKYDVRLKDHCGRIVANAELGLVASYKQEAKYGQ